jgi:hypothetical protein
MSNGEFLMVVFGFFIIGGAVMMFVLQKMIRDDNPDAGIAAFALMLGLVLFTMVGTGITVHLFGLEKPYIRGVYAEIAQSAAA